MSTERTGHLERTAQEPRHEHLHEVTLGRIDQVNERVRLLRLVPQSGPVSFSPGQWLDTYVPGIAKPGGFTLTSPPSAATASEPYLELAVQESPDNPVAAWLWRPADNILGSVLRVRVGGSFVFPPPGKTSAGIRRVVFVAGGVGINPLMSILSSIAEGSFDGDVRILYASKLPQGGVKDVLFLPRIAEQFKQGRLRGRLRVFATGAPLDSHPQDGVGEELEKADIDIQAGRFSHDDLRAAIGREEQDSCVVYVCGPPTMTDEIVEMMTSAEGLGLQKCQVMTEKWW